VVVVVEIGGEGSEDEVDVVGTGRRAWFGCDELVVEVGDEEPVEVDVESEPVEDDVVVDGGVVVDVEVDVDDDVDVGPTG
jgi:hypothetical protein